MAKIDVKNLLNTLDTVTSALNTAAADSKISLEQKDVAKVAPIVKAAVDAQAVIVQKDADARMAHATNTEANWFQKRSFWSAIVGGVLVVGAPILLRYGIEINEADKEFWIQTLTTVGGIWAGYLAYRAGTATKPLGS